MTNESKDFPVKLLSSGGYPETMEGYKDTIEIQGPEDKQKLEVMFERTIRVADNDSTSQLPPVLGTFPLYNVSDYKHTLPFHIALKGGLFLPMYREYLES